LPDRIVLLPQEIAVASLVKRNWKTGPAWYIQYYVGNQQRRIHASNNFQIAKEKLRRFEAAKAAGDDLPLPTRTLISEKKLDALIDVLTVECITAHLQRRTELVWRLANELGVEIRRYWRPDERWLSGYQKIQLAHLIGELRGPSYAKAAELKQKCELVADLAKLFTDAAEGHAEDGALAGKLNAWLPFNLRDELPQERTQQASAA
jgi:hypothetical protein